MVINVFNQATTKINSSSDAAIKVKRLKNLDAWITILALVQRVGLDKLVILQLVQDSTAATEMELAISSKIVNVFTGIQEQIAHLYYPVMLWQIVISMGFAHRLRLVYAMKDTLEVVVMYRYAVY